MVSVSLFRPSWSSAKKQSGAFDLPSVLIGVAVVAILAIGVMATIFGIVPYAQNKAAEQNLSAVVTAQGTYYAQYADTTSQYTNLAGLQAVELLGNDIKTDTVAVVGDQDQWAIATVSASGQAYIATNDKPTPAKYGTTKKTAAGATGRMTLADSLAYAVGLSNTATPASVDAPLTITSAGRSK